MHALPVIGQMSDILHVTN